MTGAFLQMAGVFSELELHITRQRVRSGIANARAKGKRLGRPPTTLEDIPAVFYKHYPLYAQKKISIVELTRLCKISRTTVYKYLGLLKSAV
jgi:DNA invertase Pin-like site-specific DNA recombinase